jgi:hypothetical protein
MWTQFFLKKKCFVGIRALSKFQVTVPKRLSLNPEKGIRPIPDLNQIKSLNPAL